jgi:Flp pilus assembly protein TadD
MRFNILVLAAAPLIVAAVPAEARDERVASTEITQGAFAKAEAKLQNELRIYPNKPELLLNLAAVYARTGRGIQAQSLYTRVLEQDDVLMNLTAERTAGSHAIAQNGLRRLQAVQMTSR